GRNLRQSAPNKQRQKYHRPRHQPEIEQFADRSGSTDEYLIPPVPEIQRTTLPAEIVTTDVTERSPFKLVDMENKVQQIWVKTEEDLRKVTAEHPVAVLFGHSCAIYHNCTCGQLFSSLPPAQSDELQYYIPPCSAIFYRPGLLINLIPETDFASCYVVNTISNTDGYTVIVVHKDLTDGVRVRNDPLESALWQDLKGTDFRSASVALSTGKSAIWHTSSKMAVYFVGNKENARFGNPAAILSHIPDFRGCVLSPEIVRIGTKADGWRESLKICTDDQLDLANTDNLQEVWIGMCRSSMSGERYWLNGSTVEDTNWEEGEPGPVHGGQCAIMSLEDGFGWRDEDCCKAAHP
ncbi:Lithostathine-1-beta, partial [Dissostichus eleginoides]